MIARILFIYAKLNPGQGYVQGMNELIGPIYYVFANDKLEWSGKLRVSFVEEPIRRFIISNSSVSHFPIGQSTARPTPSTVSPI